MKPVQIQNNAQAQERTYTQAEVDAMLVSRGRSLSCKVSEKKAVSVYGLGRFPITLYVEQWEKLFLFIDTVKAFIVANRHLLTTKAQAEAAKAATPIAK
jgi:hypothetical protein